MARSSHEEHHEHHELARVEKHLEDIKHSLNRIERHCQRLHEQGTKIMAQIDDLKQSLADLDAQVEQQTTVEQSAITLLQQLHDMLGQVIQAPDLQSAIDQVQAVRTKLSADQQALADAIAANTPAATP